MNKIIFKICVSLLIFHCASARSFDFHSCERSYDEKICWMSGLRFTRENYTIEFYPNDYTETYRVRASTIPILSTKKICEAMPNIKSLVLYYNDIEEIEEGTLQNCKNLDDIDLNYNNFTKLERNTFKGLKNLTYIGLSGGYIPVLDLDLSASGQMNYLKFSDLNMTIFNPDTLRNLSNLEYLVLASNNLFDLDVEKILKYTPKLKYINLMNNNFKCSRVDEIRLLLAERKMELSTDVDDNPLRNKKDDPERIKGMHCYENDKWELEFSKISKDFQKLIISCEQPKILGTMYDLEDEGERCLISKLKLTREKPTTEEASLNAIKTTHLIELTVPILSKGICEVLPNLENFEATNTSIEEIEFGAFSSCEKLNSIDLRDNNFAKVERNTFKGLKNLRTLLLSGGNVPLVNLDLRSSTELKELRMTGMNITVFSSNTLRKQKKLESLLISQNNLFDLDIEKILKYCPDLKYIDFNGNNFKCTRLNEMILALEEVGIEVFKPQMRDDVYDEIDGIPCLTDDKWSLEVSKLDYELQKLVVKEGGNAHSETSFKMESLINSLDATIKNLTQALMDQTNLMKEMMTNYQGAHK